MASWPCERDRTKYCGLADLLGHGPAKVPLQPFDKSPPFTELELVHHFPMA